MRLELAFLEFRTYLIRILKELTDSHQNQLMGRIFQAPTNQNYILLLLNLIKKPIVKNNVKYLI